MGLRSRTKATPHSCFRKSLILLVWVPEGGEVWPAQPHGQGGNAGLPRPWETHPAGSESDTPPGGARMADRYRKVVPAFLPAGSAMRRRSALKAPPAAGRRFFRLRS